MKDFIWLLTSGLLCAMWYAIGVYDGKAKAFKEVSDAHNDTQRRMSNLD